LFKGELVAVWSGCRNKRGVKNIALYLNDVSCVAVTADDILQFYFS
jgi:hypothetical protein